MSTPTTHRQLFGGRRVALVLVGPAIALITVFVIWPAIRALSVSASSWTGFTPVAQFIGLSNYRALWQDERFWQSVKNTLYFAMVGGLVHFVFAFTFAAALTHPRAVARKFFQTLIVFPAFISVAGVAILWGLLYEPQTGLLNRLLPALGLPGPTWLSPENGMCSVVIAATWAGIGGHMLILIAGIRRIPQSYFEAARLDGASEWHVFTRVTLPMLKPVTYAIVALWIIGAMQIFGLVQALRGPSLPRQLETIATYQYAISFNARDNLYMMGQGAAMAVVLVALIVVGLAVIRLVFGRQQVEY